MNAFVSLLLTAAAGFQSAPTIQTADGLRSPAPPPILQPNPAITPELRGDIMMARKMYREAIDFYRPGAEKNAVLANKTGIAYHQLQDLKTAKKYYERAIKLNPQYAEAINNLGTVHYAEKSYRRAISQYRKALRITPNSASVLSNLGTAYFARKQYEEAFKTYQTALSLDPEVFERRGTNGVLLQDRSVNGEERSVFFYMVAKTYAQAGIVDRTLQYIRMALENGFKDRGKFKDEVEFNFLKDNPEFQQLLAAEYKVL